MKKEPLSILVIHGPNLNLLGTREPEIYGTQTLADIDSDLKKKGEKLGFRIETFQSNHEGAIIDKVQQAATNICGLIINPAAYTHTSVAIRDALQMLDLPVVEIHLSNIYQREPFRHKSLIAPVITGQIAGFGARGYLLALDAVISLTG